MLIFVPRYIENSLASPVVSVLAMLQSKTNGTDTTFSDKNLSIGKDHNMAIIANLVDSLTLSKHFNLKVSDGQFKLH